MQRVLQKKIEPLLFYITLAFLPFQLGYHFWPPFSYVNGIRIDYLSPTLYISDCFIFLLIMVYGFNNRKKLFKAKKYISLSSTLLIVFIVFGISISARPFLGMYGLIKILEMVLFSVVIAARPLHPNIFLLVLGTGIIFQVVLAVFQFLGQGSLQGIFYYFGERFFTGETPGIANASLNGRLVLRPYATFPHPNVFAGYLLIIATILYMLRNVVSTTLKPALYGVIIVTGIGIAISFSRTVWILGFIFVIVEMWRNKVFNINKEIFLACTVAVTILVIYTKDIIIARLFSLSLVDNSFIQRIDLVTAAISLFISSPVVGVGLNNFLVNLPAVYPKALSVNAIQPVHNIFLLVVSELGTIGVLVIALVIKKIYRRIKKITVWYRYYFYWIFIFFIVIGLLDHYFLTLQQGQLITALTAGLLWNQIYLKKSS